MDLISDCHELHVNNFMKIREVSLKSYSNLTAHCLIVFINQGKHLAIIRADKITILIHVLIKVNFGHMITLELCATLLVGLDSSDSSVSAPSSSLASS